MAQRRFHYEQAFEHFLRANRVPYVAVDEAKKALMPAGVAPSSSRGKHGGRAGHGGRGGRGGRGHDAAGGSNAAEDGAGPSGALKSFDFVIYTPARNLLVDVKGRMFGAVSNTTAVSSRRYESWVTRDDVESLEHWQRLFGPDFQAVFVFAYCLRQQPPDALFEELFAFGERWYALREVGLDDYRRAMVDRSARWQTVHVPGEAFSRISRPFSVKDAPAAEPACG